MWNDLSDEEKLEAITKATPRTPREEELGGGFYYKCYWISCNEDLKKWYEYCPQCGQKIDWKGIK